MTTRAQAEAARGQPLETLATRYREAERTDFKRALAQLVGALADGHRLPDDLIEDAAFSVPPGAKQAALIAGSADPWALAERLEKKLDAQTSLFLGAELLRREPRVPRWVRITAAGWVNAPTHDERALELVADALRLVEHPHDERARAGLQRFSLEGECILKLLPESPTGPQFTVRREARQRPNDACGCGSGQKYKRCCAGKPEAPVVRTLFERSSEVLPTHVEGLKAWDWRSLNLEVVPDATLLGLANLPRVGSDLEFLMRVLRETQRRRLSTAALAFEVLASAWVARDEAKIDEVLPLAAGQGERWAAFYENHKAFAPAFDALERHCEGIVQRRHDDLSGIFFSTHWPALGLMLSRAALLDCPPERRRLHGDHLRYFRQKLGLSDPDPGSRLISAKHDALFDAEQRAATMVTTLGRTIEDSKPTVLKLDRAEARVRELETEVKALREQLLDPSSAEAREARLRMKIDELKGELTLTKEALRAAREVPDAQVVEAPVREDWTEPGEDAAGEEVDGPPRFVHFEAGARGSLERLPEAIVRHAHERAGELGGGRSGAFREVKRMRGARVFTVRLGIHYRMLFTLDPGVLRVLDVVHRAELDRAIDRAAPRPSAPRLPV